jgi:ribose 1,5-bisphosphokinase PhnN
MRYVPTAVEIRLVRREIARDATKYTEAEAVIRDDLADYQDRSRSFLEHLSDGLALERSYEALQYLLPHDLAEQVREALGIVVEPDESDYVVDSEAGRA